MRHKIVYITTMALFTIGCSGFLEERSQSEIHPSTVVDMEKLLEGEAYPNVEDAEVLNTITDIFTDDIKSNMKSVETSMQKLNVNHRGRFVWEVDMFGSVALGTSDIKIWTVCYSHIKGCNVILDYIDDMTGDHAKRDHLKGEAYVLRGFYYLMLTNFFGMPYTYGDPESDLAVPLKLASGVTTDFDNLKKSSVAECYRQIEKDLTEGIRLMEGSRKAQSIKLLRLNYLTGCAILSRMYLYKGDFQNALKYADLVLSEKSELLDLKASKNNTVYGSSTSTEVLWTMEAKHPTIGNIPTVIRFPYTLSNDFINTFETDVDNGVVDARGDYVVPKNGDSPLSSYVKQGEEIIYSADGYTEIRRIYWPAVIEKGNPYFDVINSGGARVAEMYLNRAEVYCRNYINGNAADGQKALNDLNYLRRHRFYDNYVDKTLVSFRDAQELLEFCLRERRRELCGESNHRWFDLRRLGMPEIKHIYINNDDFETEYILPAMSPKYKLPIPKEVLDRNPSLNE